MEVLDLLKGVRALLVVIMYGGLVLGVGSAYLLITGKIEEKIAEANPAIAMMDRKAMFAEMMKSEQFTNELGPWLEKIGGTRLVDSLADGSMPLILLVVLLFSSVALPALVLITGYDRLSEDLHTRYARFVLQRIRRESWVLGKVLGQWAGVLALVIVVHVLLVALASLTSPRFDAAGVWRALPLVWIGMAMFLLAYVGFVQIFSGLAGRPFTALAFGGMGLMGMWLLKLIVPAIGEIWMGAWDLRLWLLDPIAIAVFLAHAGVLIALAVLVVRTKDV